MSLVTADAVASCSVGGIIDDVRSEDDGVEMGTMPEMVEDAKGLRIEDIGKHDSFQSGRCPARRNTCVTNERDPTDVNMPEISLKSTESGSTHKCRN